MGNVSPPPPSAKFVVRFQWLVGGRVLLHRDEVSGGDRAYVNERSDRP